MRLLQRIKFLASIYPKIQSLQQKPADFKGDKLTVLTPKESEKYIPDQAKRQEFQKENSVVIQSGVKHIFMSQKTAKKKFKTKKDTEVYFSQGIIQKPTFLSIASNVLSSPYLFSRKEKTVPYINLYCQDFPERQYIEQLVHAKLSSMEWADMRGDQGTPLYFLEQSKRIANTYGLKLTVFQGSQLLNKGFRLMHAVGRSSQNAPIFVNLAYNGSPNSTDWYSLIGKGVCFDAGGLNLKPNSNIKQMHMDKHGATSVLSAFESAVKLKLPLNLTVSMGFVQNFLSSNSYRPLDIITSRKGLTVEIGNTDAEGRLVLADCMHWTQEKYAVKHMIELSTLTGAVVVALGTKHAGIWSNSDELFQALRQSGEEVNELIWRMPLDEYHHKLIKAKQADITNSPGKYHASSSQAAAFLENFVEKDVKWAHIDIAGTSNIDSTATGYGAQLLLNYLKNQVC